MSFPLSMPSLFISPPHPALPERRLTTPASGSRPTPHSGVHAMYFFMLLVLFCCIQAGASETSSMCSTLSFYLKAHA
jgi:hypothetical protein